MTLVDIFPFLKNCGIHIHTNHTIRTEFRSLPKNFHTLQQECAAFVYHLNIENIR